MKPAHLKQRPVNLALTTLTFPPMAIASILHRISGVVLFLLLPVMMYWLSLSLQDVSTYTEVQLMLANPYAKLVLWAFLAAAWYHMVAGVRHIVMDLGVGEGLCVSRASAIAVIGLGLFGIALLGIWIW